MLHICCCRDDMLTEEKKRKRRFSNKYHDVHPTSYSACPIRDAIAFGLSFGQAKNDPLHYLLLDSYFFCQVEKKSPFSKILGYVWTSLLLVWGNIPYPVTSCSRTAVSSLLSLPVSSLAKEEVFTIARTTATAETSVSIMYNIKHLIFCVYWNRKKQHVLHISPSTTSILSKRWYILNIVVRNSHELKK